MLARVVFFLKGLAAAGLRPELLRPPGLALPEFGLSAISVDLPATLPTDLAEGLVDPAVDVLAEVLAPPSAEDLLD